MTAETEELFDLITEFWAEVETGDPDKCWEWMGPTITSGYGVFRSLGKNYGSAHRFAYVLMHGRIPTGHVIRHKCDNPPCVNPFHLEAGTQRQNIHDSMTRGRWMSEARQEYLATEPERDENGQWLPKHQGNLP